MNMAPLTIRPSAPGDTDDRPLEGRVWTAELDGAPLAVVAVDGSAFAADPVARARHAVRVLLRHRGRLIGDPGGPS